ncbi:MAG: phosphoribosylanthranilate isomerase [Burkholderiales bacterium]|nr:phosphoribosylanthranilate isomerase [Burkholderiales bacterium]
MAAMKTRVKICGLTRPEDVDAAVAAGADAVGFVFYPPSPRCVSPETAAALAARLPPFITAVGLFVNAERDAVARIAGIARLQLLQFHGDETPEFCAGFPLPYIKAARVRPGLDLLEFSRKFDRARGILLDAFVQGYGGGGEVFDWSLIPREIAGRVVLSGGLHAANVAAGIGALKALAAPEPAPLGVDVSSGVEVAKGVKDGALIRAFIAAVRAADSTS